MKIFFKYIAIVLIVLVLSSFVFDVIYTMAFDNSTPRNKVQLVANLKNTHIDFIFLGSSRVDNHIDCDVVEKLTGKSCVNLGLQGGRLKDARILALMLEANNVSYEKLLIQVDYSYNFDDYSPSFKAMISPFINTDSFPSVARDYLEFSYVEELPFTRYALNDKHIGVREFVMQLLGKGANTNLNNGFNPLEGSGVGISGHFPDGLILGNQALEDIIDLNKDKIVLFTAPYCKSSATRDKYLNQLKLRYPKLYNFADAFDNTKGLTVNCGHLNKKGAHTFTRLLITEILSK